MKKRGVRVDAPLDFLFAVIWDKKAPLSGFPVRGNFDINFDIIFLVIYSYNYVFLSHELFFDKTKNYI